MKKIPLLNSSEFKTLCLLEKGFRYSPYEVQSKAKMQSVFEEEPGDNLDYKHKQALRLSEFDFVIYSDARAQEPLFAIEFDGPHHQFDPEQIERDIRKNRLCHLAQFPVLRITDTELADLDKFTIIEFIILRYRSWQENHNEIQTEISEYVESLSDEQRVELVKDGFADCSIDPKFRFDLRYPFPKTINVVKRLLFQHKIVTIMAESFLRRIMKKENYYLFADVSAYHNNIQFDGHDLVAKSDYVISKSKQPFFGIKTIWSEIDRQNATILKRGSVQFRIRSTLPIVHDYNPAEAPIEYYLRAGEFPVAFQELPGINAFDIANNVSEYLCLKEIEKWAIKNNDTAEQKNQPDRE